MYVGDNESAKLALEQLPKLKGTQAHITSSIGPMDTKVFSNLGIEVTYDAKQQ